MRRCVVVGGAEIHRYDRVRDALSPDDFLICCDSGLRHLSALARSPDLVVGDFDSHENPHLPVETIVLPTRKDDTDTVYAVKEAVHRGFSDFLLFGVTGGRLDHTLGNLSILLMLDSQGLQGKILDDWSEMEIVSRTSVEVPDFWSFFSLLAVDGAARGIDVKNAKYPLHGAQIDSDYPYGISNEVLQGETACISVKEGRLLLVKVF